MRARPGRRSVEERQQPVLEVMAEKATVDQPGTTRAAAPVVLASPLMRILPGLLVALGACGGKPPVGPLANMGSSPSLTLIELGLYIGTQLVERLHDDGAIELAFQPGDWKPFGRIDESGAAFRADGTRIGDLAPDGTFWFATGEVASWKLEGEALLWSSGPVEEKPRKVLRLTIDGKGVMRGFADPGPTYLFKGLTDGGSRRVALMYAPVLLERTRQPIGS